jgi:hypothetical protein
MSEPVAATPPPAPAAAAEPVGLAGWLVLPIIGLFVTPARGVFHLASYREFIGAGELLPDGLMAFIALEFIGNVVLLLVLPIFLIVLLFRKSRDFPRWYTIWAGGGLAFIVLDMIATQVLFGDILAAAGQHLLDAESMQELLRSIVTAGIWIPYMQISRRVANTFVN